MGIKYLTVSSKNQITLNREVRDALNIQSGDKVYFENTGNGILFKKLDNIEECPICNGEKIFMDSKCLICDGLGHIKGEVNMQMIIGKLVNVLISNDINIDIEKNNDFGYIVNSKSSDRIISQYINECQKFIIKTSLQEFVENEILISSKLKKEYVKLFDDKIDAEDILTVINNVQLNVVKNILKKKTSITKDEYDMFVDAFDEEFKAKVSKFLLPFAEL